MRGLEANEIRSKDARFPTIRNKSGVEGTCSASHSVRTPGWEVSEKGGTSFPLVFIFFVLVDLSCFCIWHCFYYLTYAENVPNFLHRMLPKSVYSIPQLENFPQ